MTPFDTSVPSEATCVFRGCVHPPLPDAIKCAFHKPREKCCVADCRSQVYARGRCVRHGGKRSCAASGCDGNVRIGDVCFKHAASAGVNRGCVVAGCMRMGRAQGKCVQHGGGPLCAKRDCTSHARVGGLCQRHRHQTTTKEHRLSIRFLLCGVDN
ncbi:Aste57867_19087 [Aphanomyces stellatus]|uniref:Aste57867_19087 protein n=1 Tax=Aphanomyces stellatus TaxID=120398 RepID=A0A485LC13_9STRA|nr:hypothetical protein As57867_019023 [Aphanomyces stellatus]VFT95812.1 Aste57867_19087 [Aphanomyces stellatus]